MEVASRTGERKLLRRPLQILSPLEVREVNLVVDRRQTLCKERRVDEECRYHLCIPFVFTRGARDFTN